MKPKKDIFDLFRDNQHKLNQAPSSGAWDRLENRLDQHKGRNRQSIFRILSMAAAVIVLVVFVSVISFNLNEQPNNHAEAVLDIAPFMTEELKIVNVSHNNNAQIAAYQKKYNHHLSSPILEGKANKKLVARMDRDRRDGNLNTFIAKIKREQEQSLAFSAPPSNNDKEIHQSGITMMESEIPSVAGAITFNDLVDSLPSDELGDVAYEAKDATNEDAFIAEDEMAIEKVEEEEAAKKLNSYAADLAIAGKATQADKTKSRISSAAEAMESNNTGIEQFQWLTGKWEGNVNNQVSVEQWNQVDERTLEGRGFLIVNGKSTFNEDMKIQEINGTINFIADLNGTGQPIYYELISNDGFQAVFENENIDFPNQVVLQRTNSSNFQTIYQNTQPTNIGETQQNYYLNRNYIQKEQVIRNLRRVND